MEKNSRDFGLFIKVLKKSNIEVNIDAMLSLRASCENIDTFTTAYVNGKLNEEKIKLLEVEAKARSNKDSAIKLSSSVYVMGYELNNTEIEEENFIEIKEKPSYDIDEQMSVSVPVGPVSIPVNFGLTGKVAARLEANLNLWTNDIKVRPALEADVYIESVLNAHVAEAKFGGELMLARENIDIFSDATVDVDGDNSQVHINAKLGHSLKALRGKVYVSGVLKTAEEKRFEKELINFEGFTHDKTFYEINKSVEL